MQQEQVVFCYACFDIFNEPIILSCNHSMCLLCAKESLALNGLHPSPTSSVVCPLCNTHTLLKDVSGMSVNASLKQYCDQLRTKSMKNPLLLYLLLERDCDNECSKLATVDCMQCNMSYCDECFHAVHQFVATRAHKQVPLGQLTKMRPTKCWKHKSELDHYCLTCDAIHCSWCLKDYHKNHHVVKLEDGQEPLLSVLAKKKHDANLCVSSLQQAQQTLGDQVEKTFANYNQVLQEMNLEFDKMVLIEYSNCIV